MEKFISRKLNSGYSSCFRQWRATDTHCSFLHGYAVSFEVSFIGEIDHRNWVYDFGGFKRSSYQIQGQSLKEYFDWLFDHTVIVAQDDPFLDVFMELHDAEIIQLRVLPDVGCEMFAKHVHEVVSGLLDYETMGRVKVEYVKFIENEKNSAIYRNTNV